jgi:pyruvate, water dikinase
MSTVSATNWVYRLEEVDKENDKLVGKKCANLGEMIRGGFRVPLGFALSLDAYSMFMEETGAHEEVGQYLASFKADCEGLSDLGKWTEASDVCRRIVESKRMPHGMRETIARYYRELCERSGVPACPVATRSAGPASHPGQYETFLHVKGSDNVIERVIKVWGSTFNARSLVARARAGYPLDNDPIGVAVLQMVHAKAAGVMFTLNPANGDRSKIMIEGSWGLGESVVSGSVTPDEWVVDKVVLEIIGRTISSKAVEFIVEPSGNGVYKDIEAERQGVACLTEEEVIEIARIGKEVELHYGVAQDMEWVVDRYLPFPDNVFFVQTRPETIWSKKQTESRLKSSGSVTGDVVSFWRNLKG